MLEASLGGLEHRDSLAQQREPVLASFDEPSCSQRLPEGAGRAPLPRQCELLGCITTALVAPIESEQGERGLRTPREQRGIPDSDLAQVLPECLESLNCLVGLALGKQNRARASK